MELPRNNEISHLDVITTGVESEEVEEVNDAYKDILEELGEQNTEQFTILFLIYPVKVWLKQLNLI